MKNFVCEITETLRRQVVVCAASPEGAEEIAEDLCNHDTILLNCEDFHGRKVACKGEASAYDIGVMQCYGAACLASECKDDPARYKVERDGKIVASFVDIEDAASFAIDEFDKAERQVRVVDGDFCMATYTVETGCFNVDMTGKAYQVEALFAAFRAAELAKK